MQYALTHWQTSLAGVTVILLGVVFPMIGVEVPGFHMDPGMAIATGTGMILARDGNK